MTFRATDKEQSARDRDRRVTERRMVDHDGIVRKATRVYTVIVHGSLGRIELQRYSRPYATINFDPSDRRLRARLVRSVLEHAEETEALDAPKDTRK